MLVDLNPLPYRVAIDLIKLCFDNDIDKDKCLLLTERLGVPANQWENEIEWTLDVPDKYITFFLLKWNGRLSVSPID